MANWQMLRIAGRLVASRVLAASAVAIAISLAGAPSGLADAVTAEPHANADFIGTWIPTPGVAWTIDTQSPDGACTGTSADSSLAMSGCKVTGDDYVFTLKSGSYTSNNSGTISGDSLSGMFSDSNGTMEDYTAVRAQATATKVACGVLESPVGTFSCTATVTASADTFGAPSGDVEWTTSNGTLSAPSCVLVAVDSVSSSCSVTETPTKSGNEATQQVHADYPTSGSFGPSDGAGSITAVSVAVKAKEVDTFVEGSDLASFTVSLSRASDGEVAVHYATEDGTGPDAAKAAEGDYKATKGTLVFAPGETTKQIDVECFADISLRSLADFDLVLSALDGAAFSSEDDVRLGTAEVVPRGGPKSVSVREDIDPNLRVGQVGAIKNLTTGGVGTLYVKRYDTNRIFKLNEGDWVYVGDELFLDANNASVVHFVLGGAAVIQPGSHVQLVDERHTYVLPTSRFTYLRQLLRIIHNVSHQKETIQIQTNGGIIGIKG